MGNVGIFGREKPISPSLLPASSMSEIEEISVEGRGNRIKLIPLYVAAPMQHRWLWHSESTEQHCWKFWGGKSTESQAMYWVCIVGNRGHRICRKQCSHQTIPLYVAAPTQHRWLKPSESTEKRCGNFFGVKALKRSRVKFFRCGKSKTSPLLDAVLISNPFLCTSPPPRDITKHFQSILGVFGG